MSNLNVEGYFGMTDKEKYEVQSLIFFYIADAHNAINSKLKRSKNKMSLFDVAQIFLERWLEQEEFELVQALNDTIITYDIERHMDHG